MVRRLGTPARSPVEPAEAEQGLGGQRAHRKLAGQREGLPVAVFRLARIGGTGGGYHVTEKLEAPRVLASLLVQEGQIQRALRRRPGALDLPRGQQPFRELGGPEGEGGPNA